MHYNPGAHSTRHKLHSVFMKVWRWQYMQFYLSEYVSYQRIRKGFLFTSLNTSFLSFTSGCTAMGVKHISKKKHTAQLSHNHIVQNVPDNKYFALEQKL